jgi:hypothetical protein
MCWVSRLCVTKLSAHAVNLPLNGVNSSGPVCWQNCPGGMTDTGLFWYVLIALKTAYSAVPHFFYHIKNAKNIVYAVLDVLATSGGFGHGAVILLPR